MSRKPKYVPFTWGEFLAKRDYEGTHYMITELDPEAVPPDLKEAHAALKDVYEAWDAIIQANYPEDDE